MLGYLFNHQETAHPLCATSLRWDLHLTWLPDSTEIAKLLNADHSSL